MNQKEYISIKLGDGLGIFNIHCGYPEIDNPDKYKGPTGKIIDIHVPQTHAGRDFLITNRK